MSKAILDALKTRLYASSGLNAIFGTKIYLTEGPADIVTPIMVYKSDRMSTTPYFGSVTRCELEIEFIFHLGNAGDSSGHTAATALATALATPLTGVTGFDRVRFTQIESGVPSFADDTWTMIERYRAIAHDT